MIDLGPRTGPPDAPSKYVLSTDRGHLNGDRVAHHRGTIDAGGIVHQVDLLVFSGIDAAGAESLSDQINAARSLHETSLVSARESWTVGDADTRSVVVAFNHTDGVGLPEWIAARPGRDPVGSISLLIGIAAGLDALNNDYPDLPPVHGALSTATIVVRHDQTAVVAVPPLPRPLGDLLVPAAFKAPEPSGTAADDAYALAGVIVELLTGEEPPEAPALLEKRLGRYRARPDLVQRIAQARDPRIEARPALLVNWLARLRGATVTPEEMADISLAPLAAPGGWRAQLARPRVLTALAAVLLAALVGSFLLGRNLSEPAAAVGLECDAEGQAAAAAAFTESVNLAFTWTDTDRDCFHDAYEIHWTGTDYLVADESPGTYPDPAMQIRVLVNFNSDRTSIRGLNPTSCEPDAVAEAAERFIEQTGLAVTWVDDDRDCLHNAYELNGIGTDPENADSDGDGTVDSVDIESGSGGMLMAIDEQIIFIDGVHARDHMNADAVPPTDPVNCVPEAWARAARSYLWASELPYTWDDPDGDCLHSRYEELSPGTDPENPDTDGDGVSDGLDTDTGDGMIEPLDRQFDLIGLGS